MSDPTSEIPGYRVTIKDVDVKVDALAEANRKGIAEILARLPDDAQARLRKVEIQIGAQWVVFGLIIAAVGTLIAQALTPTI